MIEDQREGCNLQKNRTESQQSYLVSCGLSPLIHHNYPLLSILRAQACPHSFLYEKGKVSKAKIHLLIHKLVYYRPLNCLKVFARTYLLSD